MKKGRVLSFSFQNNMRIEYISQGIYIWKGNAGKDFPNTKFKLLTEINILKQLDRYGL